MVRHTLVVKPDVSNRELLARAQEIAPEAVEGLSLRQFHGKYRLPIVRFEMTPKRDGKNGATAKADNPVETTSKSAASAKETSPSKAAGATARPKRSRKKATDAGVAIDGAVRQVLIDFAVDLEKAESRSELVSVIAGVDDFVKRIVTVAADAYGKRSAA